MIMAASTTSLSKKSNNKNSLYLLYNLVSRDFKLKYRRSVLGIAWSMLNPLLMMVVMTLIFSNIFRFEFSQYPFAVYLAGLAVCKISFPQWWKTCWKFFILMYVLGIVFTGISGILPM